MLIQQCFAANLFAGKTIFGSGGGSGINLGVAKNFCGCAPQISGAARF